MLLGQHPASGARQGVEAEMDAAYWSRYLSGNALSRRRFVGGAAGLGVAAAAAGLVGCSSSNSKSATSSAKPVASSTSAQAPASTAGTPGSASRPSAASSPAANTLDSTKGKPGGTLKYLYVAFPALFTIIDNRSPHVFAAFTHSGMLAQHWGTQGVAYDDYSLEPDLAQAMPEQ